jgi:hypothetical protein
MQRVLLVHVNIARAEDHQDVYLVGHDDAAPDDNRHLGSAQR